MKNLVFCSIVSLFIGGIANASAVEGNLNNSTKLHTVAIEGGIEIIGEGVDEGGYYVIISTDTQCQKIYPDGPSPDGVFDQL
jgi:hypothetical protein